MGAMTVRNIPDDVHEALRRRARQHGRSAEAEVRAILEQAVLPEIGLGTALAAFGRELAAAGYEFEPIRDRTPAGSTVDFE